MLDIPMFWLGPLGRLLPLACPEQNVANTVEAQQATNTSVSARNTVDLQGFRRQWTMTEAWLDSDEVSMFEAMFTGIMMPPHRIIDPLRKNRFRPSVSAPRLTSLWNGSADAWYVPSGQGLALSVPNDTGPYIEYVSEGDLREVSWRPDYEIMWDSVGAGNRLYPNGALKADNLTAYKSRVDPVLPGETITMSFWAHKTGTPNFNFFLATVNSVMQYSLSGLAMTISSSTWQRYSLTYTAPTDGSVVGVFPIFSALGDGVLNLGPAQLESGNVASQWETGYGAPEVVITQFATVSPRYPMTTASLTIQEL